jgi:outer membrane protein TolC
MEDRYKIGTSIAYNVNQSKVLLANATTSYYQAIKKYKVDYDNLLQVMGIDPSSGEIVEIAEGVIPLQDYPELAARIERARAVFAEKGEVGQPIFRPDFIQIQQQEQGRLFDRTEVDYWLEMANCLRPDLKVAIKDVAIAQKQVEDRYGEYLPSLQGKVNYGAQPCMFELFPSSHFNNQTFYWGAGIELSWNLFDGFGRERRIAQAKSQKRALECTYQQVLQSTHGEILDTIYAIEEATTELVNSSSNVLLAEQTIQQAAQQLDVGYITIFDYQISVDTLFQAKNNYCRAQYQLLTAYFGLRHAAGVDVWSQENQ